uniref:Leucine-rich repeat protein n=1 Tax=Paramoeba aestuarina TaxID=180227 RepID=A0A7S4PF52_9EUKA
MGILTLYCADATIGKFEKSSLSQQTLMELLISKLTANAETICDSPDYPIEITSWNGLRLNKENEVLRIVWNSFYVSGSMPLEYLPLTVEAVSMPCNYLSGTIDLTQLPDTLQRLDLQGNRLEGTIDLTCLPVSLSELTVSQNKLVGTVDLIQLPPNMSELDLSENDFEGVTDFTKLPDSLKVIHVTKTKLSGEVDDFSGSHFWC